MLRGRKAEKTEKAGFFPQKMPDSKTQKILRFANQPPTA
jgi:hypothetical protein